MMTGGCLWDIFCCREREDKNFWGTQFSLFLWQLRGEKACFFKIVKNSFKVHMVGNPMNENTWPSSAQVHP